MIFMVLVKMALFQCYRQRIEKDKRIILSVKDGSLIGIYWHHCMGVWTERTYFFFSYIYFLIMISLCKILENDMGYDSLPI